MREKTQSYARAGGMHFADDGELLALIGLPLQLG